MDVDDRVVVDEQFVRVAIDGDVRDPDFCGPRVVGGAEGVGIEDDVGPDERVGDVQAGIGEDGEAVPDRKYGSLKLFPKRSVCLFEMILESSSKFEAAVGVSSCSSVFRASNLFWSFGE